MRQCQSKGLYALPDGLGYVSVLGVVQDVAFGSQVGDCLGRCLLGGFKGCAHLIGC